MKRILVIDEDPQFRELLHAILAGKYEVLQAATSREALQAVVRSSPDLILLADSLHEVCQRLRVHPASRTLPILALVGVEDEGSPRGASWVSRVRCLDGGADDALDKPIHPEELLARIRARLRSIDLEISQKAELVVGNLSLDPATLQVRVDGREVILTPTEFELLRYFLERRERVIPRGLLLGDLWPDAVVTRRTIDTHVGNLRKKLWGFDHGFETIYGSGYRLTARREDEGASA